MKANI